MPWTNHLFGGSPIGQATCQRRTLATHRTALASTQASSLPVPRAQPLDYRKVLTGIIFVLKNGHPLGGVAPGDGLWLWHDLPELPQCLAAGRGSGRSCTRSSWPRPSRPTSSISPVPRSIVPRPEPWGAAIATGPQSDGSRQTRDQAPCPDRGSRRAAGDPQHRGQRARRQRTAAAGRQHPAGAPQGGPPPRSPGQPVRRPGLRLTAASPGVGGAGEFDPP